jgi:hypothetical protein
MDIWAQNMAVNAPRELKFDKADVNAEKFDEELKALLPDVYLSMDTSDAGILIRLSDKASDEDVQAVTDHFKSHDPQAKSEAELKRDAAAEALARLATVDVDSLENEVAKDADPLLTQIVAILRDVKTYFEGLP